VLCSIRRLKENKKNVRRQPSAMRPKRVVLARTAPDLRKRQGNVMTTIISKFRRAALAAGIALSALSVSLHAEAGSLKLGMTTWVGYGPLFLARDMGYF
jgi:NitT/TauT family transport system substrate-binding protein